MENNGFPGEGWEDDPSGFPNTQSDMDDSVKPQEEKFFRPKQRRDVRGGERSQRILRKTIHATSTLLLLSCLLFLGHRVYAHLLENPSFRVRQVEVKGCQKVGRETLLSLASIEGMPNLFTLRLKEVARRLESHPWIERVAIRKTFPNKVLIEVKERKPIAIVQMGELHYIDENGVIFCRAGDGDGYNYPFLTGLGRQALEKDSEESKQFIAKALEVLSAVEQERRAPLQEVSEIYVEKISGIHCISKTEGLEVKLGWDDFREKVKRLSLIWADLERRGLAVRAIDCSDVNRMVVKNAVVKESMAKDAVAKNATVKNGMKERPETTRTVAKRASKRGGSARR